MALEPGTRLGPYVITGLLGAGGMGEVYRARDPQLGREIAVKVLPAALANDAHRLARFEREAQLLAALNHPHIAAIHLLAEHEGTRYLAMELIEGTTLADVVARGALPVDEALRLALQIAEALEAAHGKGVVHRDLKPANVMLTRDGQIKVLDFGLAKALGADRNETAPAQSPASLAMTQQGVVLGTAGYMSPEQASGQASDQRADIWAFGVVLYEMLTGAPLFHGESVPHVLADVLKTEPDWRRLPKSLAPRIRLLLERCLTKKPRNRLHAIADARIEIEAVLADPSAAGPDASHPPRAANRASLTAAGVVIAAVAAAAGWLLRTAPTAEPAVVARFAWLLPDDYAVQLTSMIAVSPDGTHVAYFEGDRLYLRNLAETEPHPVPGTAEPATVTQPTFSPDGRWLAYVHVSGVDGPFTIKRIPVGGGAPVPIYVAESYGEFPFSLSWPTPDALLFTTARGVVRLPENGGATEVLVPSVGGEVLFSPQLLPDGKSVLFTRVPGGAERTINTYDAAQVAVQSIGQQDRKVVLENGSAARYVPSGHLVYARGRALLAIGFDAEARAVRGGAVSVAEGLARSSGVASDAANFAVSETGTLALIAGESDAASSRIQTTLTWVDRSGREEPLTIPPDDYTMARLSPDGTRVALVIGAALGRQSPEASLWIYDFRTENLRLVATEPANADGPVWWPDGKRILFRGFRPSGGDLSADVFSIEIDTGEVTLMATGSESFPRPMPWALAPDGQTLAVVNARAVGDVNIATLSLGNQQLAALFADDANYSQPAFSPDGAYIALREIRANGAEEIFVRDFPAVARTRVPVAAGTQPVFSRDGSELFFYDGRGFAAASISYEPALRIGPPRRLFESSDYFLGDYGRAWDLDASGQRFLMIRNADATRAAPAAERDDRERPHIDVVVNWLEELKSRVPVGER
jgi:serine/threonine-protein kinase